MGNEVSSDTKTAKKVVTLPHIELKRLSPTARIRQTIFSEHAAAAVSNTATPVSPTTMPLPKMTPQMRKSLRQARVSEASNLGNMSTATTSASIMDDDELMKRSSIIMSNLPLRNIAWNCKKYLRKVFNEMDLNKDGSITAIELQKALRLTQSSEFNVKTVNLLLVRYDTNGDHEISFDEFYDLYMNLNEEYEGFLLMDTDGSGGIDIDELREALRAKGYMFSAGFFKLVMDEVNKHTGGRIIEFDNYIRIGARFDFLCHTYNKIPYMYRDSLETYMKKTFFVDFWWHC